MVDRDRIEEVLAEVIDPELGLSMLELKLVDELEIREDGKVRISFHLTAPFCPPMFALKMAQDVKEGIQQVEGVKEVVVNVTGHYMADYINKVVNGQQPSSEGLQGLREEESSGKMDKEGGG